MKRYQASGDPREHRDWIAAVVDLAAGDEAAYKAAVTQTSTRTPTCSDSCVGQTGLKRCTTPCVSQVLISRTQMRWSAPLAGLNHGWLIAESRQFSRDTTSAQFAGLG